MNDPDFFGNRTRHLRNNIVWNIQKGCKLPHTSSDLPENEFFNGSPVKHKSLEDVPFCSKHMIIKDFYSSEISGMSSKNG